MKSSIQRHGEKIPGVLSGFDRMRFRGTLLRLTGVGGMVHFLTQMGVLLKDFGAYADDLTQRLRRLEETAASEGRPVQYLERATDKEALVQKIRADRGEGEQGLIAVFRTLENCISYDIYHDRQTQRIELRRRPRKCLHYYFHFSARNQRLPKSGRLRKSAQHARNSANHCVGTVESLRRALRSVQLSLRDKTHVLRS